VPPIPSMREKEIIRKKIKFFVVYKWGKNAHSSEENIHLKIESRNGETKFQIASKK